MDIIGIAGLLGNLITIEEGGRSFLPFVKRKIDKKKLRIRWDSSDPAIERFILKGYCDKIGTNFDEGTYDSKITDIDNQHVKEETGLIKNICGIAGSISPDSFKKNLAECIREDMLVYKELERVVFNRE